MSEKRFEDDGVEYTNNFNYALLDTYYEFDGKMIIEWNKHSSNAEYTDFERITEILNIKQMRLESLMKHREEIGKLFDRIDEQQATIEHLTKSRDKWSKSAKLHSEYFNCLEKAIEIAYEEKPYPKIEDIRNIYSKLEKEIDDE